MRAFFVRAPQSDQSSNSVSRSVESVTVICFDGQPICVCVQASSVPSVLNSIARGRGIDPRRLTSQVVAIADTP